MKATILDSTGEVIGILEAPDQAHINMNIPEGGRYIEGAAPENAYWVGDDWVIKPVQPNIYCRWDAVLKVWNDPRSLDQLKEQKWATIKEARDTALTDFLTTPYGVFDATDSAQKSITDAVLMLQTLASLGTPTNINFTLANNTTITLTTTEMVQVGLLLGQRTQTVYANGRAKRIAIDSAATIAEVEAIVW